MFLGSFEDASKNINLILSIQHLPYFYALHQVDRVVSLVHRMLKSNLFCQFLQFLCLLPIIYLFAAKVQSRACASASGLKLQKCRFSKKHGWFIRTLKKIVKKYTEPVFNSLCNRSCPENGLRPLIGGRY